MAYRVIATARFADQLRNAPGELRGFVSAVAAVLRVEPTVASAAFNVVGHGEEYTAIFGHGRGFLAYWVPAGHDVVLLEWLVWADQAWLPGQAHRSGRVLRRASRHRRLPARPVDAGPPDRARRSPTCKP